MKVVVLIPCLNEEATLPLVLQSIPKKISGVSQLDVVVVDDGSTDKTVEVARAHGVKHFVRHANRQGLARSFHDGVQYALEHGADAVVSTDGDNQYPQERIPDLIKPIQEGRADIVIADRQVHTIAHFSGGKKFFQRLGTKVVNMAAGTDIPDAPSGFRAYSREALLRLNIVTRFSYAMETIIQAGNKNLAVASVPVTTNPKTRESRLFRSNWEHALKSGVAIVRAFIMYRPYAVFMNMGALLLVLGLVPFIRYLYFVTFDVKTGQHIQLLIAGSVLLVTSFIAFALGVIADLIRINRVLNETTLEHTKRLLVDRRHSDESKPA